MTHPTTTLHPSLDVREERAAQQEIETRVAELRRESDRAKRLPEAERIANRAAVLAEACGDGPDGPRYSTADVLGWILRATNMGAAIPLIGPDLVEDIFRVRKVPNAPLRDRFLALLPDFLLTHELTQAQKDAADKAGLDAGTYAWAAEIGQRIGETIERAGRVVGDATRVLRLLGLALTDGGHKRPNLRLFISYEQGVALADALNLSYVEAGV